jgi:hypothetical protein
MPATRPTKKSSRRFVCHYAEMVAAMFLGLNWAHLDEEFAQFQFVLYDSGTGA